MRASYLKVISLLLVSALFAGCWDAAEIEEHTIVTGLVIDYKDGNYSFYCETAEVLGTGNTGETPDVNYQMLKSSGRTFIEARDVLERSTNFPILLSSVRVAIFTHGMCDIGLEPYMNRIRGEFDYRKTVLIAITPDDPEKIITHTPKNTPSISAALENLFRSMTKKGISFEINIGEVLEYLAVENVGYLLPQIELKNNQFLLSGHCIMKGDKRAGHIPAEVMDGNMCLLLRKRQFEYHTYYKDNGYTINIKLKKRRIMPKIIDGKIHFDVDLKFEGTILYAEKMVKLSKKEVKMLANLVEQEFKNKIDEAVQQAQKKFRCDYLDFFKHFRAKYQKQFRQIENWNEAFAEANINTKVSVKIVGTSMLSIEEE